MIESLGRETLLYADAGAVQTVDSETQESFFAVHRSSQVVAHPGDAISLGVARDSVFLFDRTGRTIRFPEGSAIPKE